jgi:hypothetical protein
MSPNFKNVPSMRLDGQKTSLAFHAKYNLPEVRKEVFTLLRQTFGLRFFSVVTDKYHVLEQTLQSISNIFRVSPDIGGWC